MKDKEPLFNTKLKTIRRRDWLWLWLYPTHILVDSKCKVYYKHVDKDYYILRITQGL